MAETRFEPKTSDCPAPPVSLSYVPSGGLQISSATHSLCREKTEVCRVWGYLRLHSLDTAELWLGVVSPSLALVSFLQEVAEA